MNTLQLLLAIGFASVAITALPTRLRQLKQRIVKNREKFSEAGWELASSIEDARVLLQDYKGEFQKLIGECGIGKSHCYGLLRALRLKNQMPDDIAKKFSGPSALICLSSNDQAVSVAENLAAYGEIITVEKAKAICADIARKANRPKTVKIVLPGIATVVAHQIAGVSPEQIALLEKCLRAVADKFQQEASK